MWVWDQSKGELTHNGRFVGRGYSGAGRGKNNPSLQGVAGVGPVPRGQYRIGPPYNSSSVGPFTLPIDALDAVPGDDIHQGTGRGNFRIHGDAVASPGNASRGCIILPRNIRDLIWNSGDRELEVVE